jgi:hypothetical protein
VKLVLAVLSFVSIAAGTSAAVFNTNGPDGDAFVRAAAPTVNYGAAGALAVSGPDATNDMGVTNGVFDSFIRFNTGAMVTNFNAAFGSTNWVITSATLNVTEVAAPAMNAIFNQGTGWFEVRWIADDNWDEGTGTPMGITTTGITYDEEPSLLNSNTDMNLGMFTNAGLAAALSFPLALPAAFVTNMQAGGEVGFFLTAISPEIGFTFNSRNFPTTSAHPFLVVSAAAQPGISGVTLCGTNIVLLATNGVAGGTYAVLTSTNLASPLNQWTPIATNVPSDGGNFTITVTNAARANASSPQFFILQTH